MIKVIEISGKNIPGNVFGVAYKFGERLGRQVGYMEYGGATITAKRTGDTMIVLVDVTSGNFITTPRAVGAGGYYPAPDSPDTSQTLSIDEDGVPEISRDDMMYGNTDWRGFNTAEAGEPSDAPILTWKGVASRHFEINPDTAVDGYMLFDEEVMVAGLPVNKYTPFGPNIYQDGEMLDTLPTVGSTPSKVLGAAFIGSTLICVAGINYRDLQNPAGGTGGFYNEVWIKNDEWTRLDFQGASRPTANWFFNQSGTEAQSVQGGTVFKFSINPDDFAVAYTTRSACTGSATESKNTITVEHGAVVPLPGLWDYDDPANWSIPQNGIGVETTTTTVVTETQSCIEAIDYVDDVEIMATANYSLSENTVNYSLGKDYVGWIRELPYSAPATLGAVLANNGGGTFNVGDYPVQGSGGCVPYTYVGTNGVTVNSETGQITAVSCVPGGFAVGAVTVTDANGDVASQTFRMFGGSWGACDNISYGEGIPPGTYLACDNCPAQQSGWVIEGNTRVQYKYADRQITTGAIQICSTFPCWEWGKDVCHWICPD